MAYERVKPTYLIPDGNIIFIYTFLFMFTSSGMQLGHKTRVGSTTEVSVHLHVLLKKHNGTLH
jgi:hypothetical protein